MWKITKFTNYQLFMNVEKTNMAQLKHFRMKYEQKRNESCHTKTHFRAFKSILCSIH